MAVCIRVQCILFGCMLSSVSEVATELLFDFGMKKEMVSYDEPNFYYPSMPPIIQPTPTHAQHHHHNYTSIEDTVFHIIGKD